MNFGHGIQEWDKLLLNLQKEGAKWKVLFIDYLIYLTLSIVAVVVVVASAQKIKLAAAKEKT